MSKDELIEAIANEIEAQKGLELAEREAETMRATAFLVHSDHPEATSADFGDAAARLGMHRQGAMNRWNESKAIWGDEW